MAASNTEFEIKRSSFPAPTRTARALINSIETIASSTSFADKMLVTVTQNGRLSHWVHVPLDISATDASTTTNPFHDRDENEPALDLLPNHQLTATTILGGTIPELEVLGQTLATQVASAIKTRDSRETRMVVFGTGLDKSMSGREEFSELMGLVLEVL